MAHAPINGSTLAWARRLGHVEVEDLAKATGVKPERVVEFETGVSLPTFRQLTLIASKLDRTLGFFFAPPPSDEDVPSTADFRGRTDDEIPPSLTKEMRHAEQQRDAMLDFAERPGENLEIRPIKWSNIAQRAAELRHAFGLTDAFIPSESQTNQVFNFWRGQLESHGVLVFQTTKIPLETFRGLSIYHELLPIILVNGSDSASGRTFTLFHEMGHLINRTSGLCILKENINEEAIVNSFSANFLMPERAVQGNVARVDDPLDAAEHLAEIFRVSTLAAAVRLRTLDLIDDGELQDIRKESDSTWARNRERQKNSASFPPPWRLRYRDLGPTYIGAVAQALEEHRVDYVDATYLLNARLPTVEKMLSEYYHTGGAE